MSKTAVVYWSGTGNTEAMANSIVEAVNAAGGTAELFTSATFTADMVSAYDSIALGCPSMGAEVLEECEFEPMYQSIREALSGKKVGLFGSYGWGDGEWMRNWQEDCNSVGAVVVCEPVIVSGEPDAATNAQCADLAKAIVV